MKAKIILGSVVLVVMIGLALLAFAWLGRPQVLTLGDGTKLTLLGVEYGRQHKFPKVKVAGPHQNGGPGSFTTAADTLVIWVLSERKDNQWPNYQVLACDAAATGCVGSYGGGNSQQIKPGVVLMGIQLNAYPRRDRKILLRFFSWGQRGQQTSKEHFVIANPSHGPYPQWKPAPLPDTQSDGDLDVTLTRLVCGVPGFNGGMSGNELNKAVTAAFHLEQKGVAATNWQPVRIETSDATGNNVPNNSWSNTRENDEAVMTYQWGLWPDEPAWKLRVELSRTSGFNADEICTVSNVPVQPGSMSDLWNYGGPGNRRKSPAPFAEITLSGIHLNIFPALEFTDQNQGGQHQGGLRIQADPDPQQMRMTLVITDERGHQLQTYGVNKNGDYFIAQMPEMRRAKMLNLTIALHKSRFVEFTVKPQKSAEAGAR